MQEISELLVKAREAKGVDLEQAVHDTNISKVFLQGLETNNYDYFPAETYVLGFLRNYASYLGLDPEQVVKLYKQTKLQESEIPPDVMLNKKHFNKKTVYIVIAVLAAVLLISGLSIFIWNTIKSKKPHDTITAAPAINNTKTEVKPAQVITENQAKNVLINENQYSNRFFEGDSFSINLHEKTYQFKVVKTVSELQLKTEAFGTQIVTLTETLKLDLDNDAIPDLAISLVDIDKNDAAKGALLLITSGEITDTAADNHIASSTNTNYKTIFEGASAYPVTMNITFRNYCFFRYQIYRGERKEQYYQKNATLSLRADDGFRIWASNGNAVKIELIGAGGTVNLDLTKPGEVIVQDIKWIKDESSNRYKFVLMNID